MRTRSLPASAYAALKTAARQLQRDAGGIDAAAAITGKSRATHGHYQEIGDTFMPLDVVADLEQATGRMYVTEALARQHGALIVKIADIASDPDWRRNAAALMQETADVLKAIGAAFADGKISPREAGDMLKEIHDAQRVLAGIDGALRAIIDRRQAVEADGTGR